MRVSYLQAGSTSEPVHVMAERAVSHKATGVTEFFPLEGGVARMWQGGSQVTAPILDFDRTRKVLVAKGREPALVKTVIVDTAKPQGRDAAKKPGHGGTDARDQPGDDLHG